MVKKSSGLVKKKGLKCKTVVWKQASVHYCGATRYLLRLLQALEREATLRRRMQVRLKLRGMVAAV